MNAAEALRMTDDELADLWNAKHPSLIAHECGLSARGKRALTVRVSNLRKAGRAIRLWNGCIPCPNCGYMPVDSPAKEKSDV